MSRAAEFALAALAAAGLHLAGFAALGSAVPAGVESAGDGGEALVSLMTSDASVAALLEAWEKPPEMALPEVATPPAPVADPVPDLPVPEAVAAPAPLSERPDLPSVESLPDMAALAPPPKPEPEPEVKPEPDPVPAPEPVAEAPKPAPKPAAEDSVAQPAQAAAGEGGKGAAGNAGAASVATAAGAAVADLRVAWGADIRARIERRKSYPRDGDGASGTVKLRIVVGADGRLRGVAIAQSSGSDALDRAAVRAVERAGRFPGAPKGLDGEASFTLPVSFRP